MIATLLTLLASCHKDDSPAAEQSHLKIKVKDAANHYDTLYLNIEQVWTRTSAGAGKIRANKRLNILSIEKDSLIASGDVPHGSVHEIILQLAAGGNEIIAGGASHNLEMPEGQYIAIDIPENKLLIPNETHELLLDIDLSKFIEKTKDGKFSINPTISAILQNLH